MTSFSASGVYQCLAEVKIINRKGLHARASARFVRTAECFEAEIHVSRDGQTVSGNPKRDRLYSEYWTLIRAAGVHAAPRALTFLRSR